MGRIFRLFLLMALLFPVSASAAEEPQYLALAFDGFPEPSAALLAGLEARQVRATFFLREQDGAWASMLREQGHEPGILADFGPELSRREIAAILRSCQEGTAERTRLLRTRSTFTDGLRQVAKAMGFSLIAPSAQLKPLAPPEDGDILLVDSRMAAISILEMVDDLQDRGCVFLTISELARLRNVPFKPGSVYNAFPE